MTTNLTAFSLHTTEDEGHPRSVAVVQRGLKLSLLHMSTAFATARSKITFWWISLVHIHTYAHL